MTHFWEIRAHGFEPWSSQANDLRIDNCRFLARCSTFLGQNKDWLAQCQDKVTEWDTRSLCKQPGLPVMKQYKATITPHCYKVNSHPDMTLVVVRTYNSNNQPTALM